MPSLLVILVKKTLVAPHGVFSHLICPFEVWLVLDLLQDLMCWLLEYRINHLKSRRPRLPSKIPPGPVIIISVRLKIPSILWDNLSLSLPLLLVFLNLFVFVNTIHKPILKSPYSHVIKVPINLVEHLPVSVRVHFQGLPFSYGHGQ